jgi:hypothetical protein
MIELFIFSIYLIKDFVIYLAGVRGIEPRSKVLETSVLTAVLYPYSSERGTSGLRTGNV